MMSCQHLLATVSDEKLVVIIISLFETGPFTHPFESPFAFKIFCFYKQNTLAHLQEYGSFLFHVQSRLKWDKPHLDLWL